MQTIVAAQLGVEGDSGHATLASGDRMTLDLREDLHLGSVLGDPRGADEHPSQWSTLDSVNLQIGLEAAQLTSEGVALGEHVHNRQMLTVEHDQPGTRAEDRHIPSGQLAQGLGKPLALDAEGHRGGLPAGDHETVQAIEVGSALAPLATSAPNRASTCACASKSPCRARTPSSAVLSPTALSQQLLT